MAGRIRVPGNHGGFVGDGKLEAEKSLSESVDRGVSLYDKVWESGGPGELEKIIDMSIESRGVIKVGRQV